MHKERKKLISLPPSCVSVSCEMYEFSTLPIRFLRGARDHPVFQWQYIN